MRALVVLAACVGCARVVDVSVPLEVERVGFIALDAEGHVVWSTGLFPTEQPPPSLRDDGVERVLVVGYTEAAIEALDPPDRSIVASSGMLLAEACEHTLGRPLWAARVAGDGVPLATSEVPRLTVSWLRDRCPCTSSVDPAAYEITAYVFDHAGRTPAVVLDDESILVATSQGEYFRVSFGGVQSVPELDVPASAMFRTSLGRLWIANEYAELYSGTLEDGLSFVSRAPAAAAGWMVPTALAVVRTSSGADAVYMLRSSCELLLFAAGAWTTVHNDPSRRSAMAVSQAGEVVTVCSEPFLLRSQEGATEYIDQSRFSESQIYAVAAHPELGWILATRGPQMGSPSELRSTSELSARSESWRLLATSEDAVSIQGYRSGALFASSGQLNWLAPGADPVPLDVHVEHGDQILTFSEGFALTRSEDAKLISIARRRGCSALPLD